MKPLAPLRKKSLGAMRAWLDDLYDAVVANRPLRSETCDLHETPGGTLILPNFRSLAAAGIRLGLQPYDASSGSTPKIGVTPGTFGGNAVLAPGNEVPTISGVRIDAATPPVLTVGGSDVLIYLQADVNTDSQITATSIRSSNSANPPPSTVSTLYVRLATIAVAVGGGSASVGVSAVNLSGSQGYSQCGGVDHTYWLL